MYVSMSRLNASRQSNQLIHCPDPPHLFFVSQSGDKEKEISNKESSKGGGRVDNAKEKDDKAEGKNGT